MITTKQYEILKGILHQLQNYEIGWKDVLIPVSSRKKKKLEELESLIDLLDEDILELLDIKEDVIWLEVYIKWYPFCWWDMYISVIEHAECQIRTMLKMYEKVNLGYTYWWRELEV